MRNYTFRLSSTFDPHELVEEALLYAAFKDTFGDKLVTVRGPNEADFGRGTTNRFMHKFDETKYWEDPAFIDACHRKFKVCTLEEAVEFHEENALEKKNSFFKSIRMKEFTCKIPWRSSLQDAIGDMIYSFIDAGPIILMQDFIDIQYEVRCIIIDGKLVTYSGVHPEMTPNKLQHLDFMPLWRYPYHLFDNYSKLGMIDEDIESIVNDVFLPLTNFKDIVMDIGIYDDQWTIVEFNPLHIGNFGLYKCDPYKIAEAIYEKVST